VEPRDVLTLPPVALVVPAVAPPVVLPDVLMLPPVAPVVPAAGLPVEPPDVLMLPPVAPVVPAVPVVPPVPVLRRPPPPHPAAPAKTTNMESTVNFTKNEHFDMGPPVARGTGAMGGPSTTRAVYPETTGKKKVL
jgi:hypothetical protein